MPAKYAAGFGACPYPILRVYIRLSSSALCVGIPYLELKMSELGTKRRWYKYVQPKLPDAPKHLIEEMRVAGIDILERDGSYSVETVIPTGSPQYRKFLSLLADLPEPTKVEISLQWTKHGEEGNELHKGLRSRRDYFWDLFSCLPSLNPDHRPCECCDCCSVRGDARTIVKDAVSLVEDPPEDVPGARELPEGRYVQTVELIFGNVIFPIPVFRKSSGALAVHPPMEDRKPVPRFS